MVRTLPSVVADPEATLRRRAAAWSAGARCRTRAVTRGDTEAVIRAAQAEVERLAAQHEAAQRRLRQLRQAADATAEHVENGGPAARALHRVRHRGAVVASPAAATESAASRRPSKRRSRRLPPNGYAARPSGCWERSRALGASRPAPSPAFCGRSLRPRPRSWTRAHGRSSPSSPSPEQDTCGAGMEASGRRGRRAAVSDSSCSSTEAGSETFAPSRISATRSCAPEGVCCRLASSTGHRAHLGVDRQHLEELTPIDRQSS